MRKLFIVFTLMLVLTALVGAVGNNGPGIFLPKDPGIAVSITPGFQSPIFSGAPVSCDVFPVSTESIILAVAARTATEGIEPAMRSSMRTENYLSIAPDSATCIADIFITEASLPDRISGGDTPLGYSKSVESNNIRGII
jgi:hypothetical protein